MGAVLPVLSIIGTVVGGVVSAAGAMQGGQAAAAQAKYQAQVAKNNAIMANWAADDAINRGRSQEQIQRLKTAQLISRQRAALASNGVLVDAGSALNLVEDTAMIGEFDALTIRDNAAREAWQNRAQGANFTAEAQLAKMRASSAQQSGFGTAFGTLLTTAGSVGSKWYDFNNEGTNVLWGK